MTVRTCLARIPLADVAREGALAGDFTPIERTELEGRPDRTIAGRLALKIALVGLWAQLVPGQPVRPRDFVLRSDSSGAPRLRSFPEGIPGLEVQVSIAHSADLAVGLAAAFDPRGAP